MAADMDFIDMKIVAIEMKVVIAKSRTCHEEMRCEHTPPRLGCLSDENYRGS
jgi:hypothetical protein